jgi:hypothetical protein
MKHPFNALSADKFWKNKKMWQVYVLDSSTVDCEPELLKTVKTLEDAVESVVQEYMMANLALPDQCPPIHLVPKNVPYSPQYKWNPEGAFFQLKREKKIVPIAAIYYPGLGTVEHYAMRKPRYFPISLWWCCGHNMI